MMRSILCTVKLVGLAAAIWSVAISGYMAITPRTGHGVRGYWSSDGTQTWEPYTTKTRDLSISIILFIPLAMSISGGLAAWRGQLSRLWWMAASLSVFSFISGFSIGLAYVPAALALLASAGLLNFQYRRCNMGKIS